MSTPSQRSARAVMPSRLPLVQAPMAGGPSTPELAAAVSAAGGFGYVAGGYLSPDALDRALVRTRALMDAPVGVNLFVPGRPDADDAAIAEYARTLTPEAARLGVELGEPRWDDDGFDAKVDLLASAGVHTVSFTFGLPPAEAVTRLQDAAVVVAVTVTSRTEAEAAAGVGADVLVVQGTEAGGHQGTFDPDDPNPTPLLEALTPIRPLGLPMIAAGGIMTAADVGRVLDAGAVAAQVGTALLCTPRRPRRRRTGRRCWTRATPRRCSPVRSAVDGHADWPTGSRSSTRMLPVAIRRSTT